MTRWPLVLATLLAACGSRSDLAVDDLDGQLAGGAAASEDPEGKCSVCSAKISSLHLYGMRPTCSGAATALYQVLLACACRPETCQDACFNYKQKVGPMYELCGDDEYRFSMLSDCSKCLKTECAHELDACRANKANDP